MIRAFLRSPFLPQAVALGALLAAVQVLGAQTPRGGQTAPSAVSAPQSSPPGEWRTYGGDLSSTRYSPLDQITGDNFNRLKVAWRFRTESLGPRPDFLYQTTPIMARGVVYATAGTRRSVVALDAATGELL